MKLTKQAEIAVQILALCAGPRSNNAVTTRRAAEFAGTTKDHAAHVVAKLSRNGYLESERGRAGGIWLGKPASAINVGEILRLMEPELGAVGNDVAEDGAFDVLRRVAAQAYLSTFDSFTIADLVANPSSSRVGCLDCDLHTLIRRGNSLSRLRSHPAFGKSAVPKPGVHTA